MSSTNNNNNNNKSNINSHPVGRSRSQLPTPKAKKYDRQLRLWGDHGQQAIEQARVLLIGANAVGTETLKNMVLPGVGSFTIMDHRRVTEEDCGSNFFVELARIGEPRAKVCAELLRELNEDVIGDFLEDRLDVLLQRDPGFFTGFSLVIASGVRHSDLLVLSDLLYDRDVPLIVCQQHGMLATCQLVAREHFVWEAHPDNPLPDLRLENPLPEFVAFCDAQDLSAMDSQRHSHTPWLVILYKFLSKWRQANAGKFPSNYAERQAVRQLIRSGERGESDLHGDEENWRQAQSAVTTALLPSKLPSNVNELFKLADQFWLRRQQLSDSSAPSEDRQAAVPPSNWLLLCRTLAEFYRQRGCLPLCGTLPDMVSDSDRYVALLNIYRRAADADLVEFSRLLRVVCLDIGLSADSVPASQIALFCKNARHLRLVKTASYRELSRPQPQTVARCLEETAEAGPSPFWWYLLFHACDRFHTEFGRFPGDTDDVNFLADAGQLKLKCQQLAQDWLASLATTSAACPTSAPEDLLHELCRFGRAEVHSVAAWMGGVLAQEGIKLITGQFVPETRTMLYDAVSQTFLPVF
ncbi:hypothetical protein BOX15_Mlig028533g3 [Macrostomum lignano]|uniref:NEDD8-activating enzyme E1 regulatory subunit n=1 Tax=Macrostomum lignano TaxID=282301 RepID=A0A267FRT8_9PLAT|nr:hypothetical protein BOX15_Mlig028533g3 [Macrostomum lignano]